MRQTLMAFAVAAALTGPAFAAPIQWTSGSGGNDHWYEFVAAGATWSGARSAALSMSYQGQQGYLATVTSAPELNFLLSLYDPTQNFAWLGGSDAAVEGQWRWIDGPEAGQLLSYTNWNGGEPNNFGDEDYLHINALANGTWNDLQGDRTLGYLVEYSQVPVPGSLALMVPALLALGLTRRRRPG